MSILNPGRASIGHARRGATALAIGGSLVLGLSACGSDDKDASSTADETPSASAAIKSNSANASTTISIGSKGFPESKSIASIYGQALAAAGYTVKYELGLGTEDVAFAALKKGKVSAYPEYTGTAALSLLKLKTNQVSNDPQELFDSVKSGLAKEDVVAEQQTPFTNSNEVAVTAATAKKYNLKTIEDLKAVAPKLKFYGSPECRKRLDCLKGLQDTYGIKFKKYVPVDPAQRSEVLVKGAADVSIVFTTDPANVRNKFVLLEDTKNIFPPYNTTLLVRKDVADKAGEDLPKTIEAVNKFLTNEAAQEINARTDLDKDTPESVATDFLKAQGLVK